ncbi:hypothetical protein [Stella sp.]|uniref:hypothetical protein n=1 Tax=Stella sp. TaxID=2912054 RepID=UPI0035AFA0CD|nr:hypothetical protein [Alphaproteobacteria bacterium]
MLLARWQIEARFGQKQAVIELLKTWERDIAPQIGWGAGRGRLLSGSIGPSEATVEHEWLVEDLAALGRAWEALGRIEAHREWGKALEPHVVSGSARWQVLRIV